MIASTGPQGFCRDGAILDEPTIGQSIRRCAVGLGFSQQELDGLEHIFLSGQSKDLVPIRDAVEAENRLYTTQAMLDAESRIAKTREQKADRWVDITGPAGCGKSRSLGAAIEVMRSLPNPSNLRELRPSGPVDPRGRTFADELPAPGNAPLADLSGCFGGRLRPSVEPWTATRGGCDGPRSGSIRSGHRRIHGGYDC